MVLGIEALMLLQRTVLVLLQPFFWYFNRKALPKIPLPRNDILKYSAVAIAEKIRRKELKSETVVRAYVDRINEVDPYLNAVVENRFEAAIREAKICDDAIAANEVDVSFLEREKPLYGVPVTVKESCSLKDMSHTGCTLPRVGIKATTDGPSIASLKNAGAIPLCVTNTPELCLGFESTNYVYGTSNNPYDLRRTPGGSSGGEAALLGASASLIGVGSDIAGSIRVPALFTGVFGHKPSPGVIPTREHFPISEGVHFQKYLVVGPLCRYAEDLILAVKVMSGAASASLKLDDPVDVGKLKVTYLDTLSQPLCFMETDDDTRIAIRRAADYLATKAADVQQAQLPQLNKCLETILGVFFGVNEMPRLLIDPNDPKHERNALAEAGKSLLGLSQHTKLAIITKFLKDINVMLPRSKLPIYQKELERLKSIVYNHLGNNGVLLFPSYSQSAPLHGQTPLLYSSAVYCLLINVLELPATQVPLGFNSEGLPVGCQVVAGPMQDRLSLAVARELETGFGGWTAPGEVH